MLEFPTWRIWMLNIIVVLAVLLAIPSLLPKQYYDYIPDFLPKEQINLGLDLAGGSHILLEANPAELEATRLEKLEGSIINAMRRADPVIKIDGVSRDGGKLSFTVNDVSKVDAARAEIEPLIGNALGSRDWDFQVLDENRIELSPNSSGTSTALDQAMDTAREVISKRINSDGTLEPTIIRQGDNRIVVQVPGIEDPQALKELIGKTAKLEFKLVDQNADPDDLVKGIAKPGSQIFPHVEGSGNVAVRRLGGISGDRLVGAEQGFEQETNQPVVNISFDSEGARQFAVLTTKHLKKPFAIILDGEVLSTPVIQSRILGGASQISGNFTVEGANQLAVQLRSGALPIELKIVEERTVGADLGQDSIDRGALAAMIGIVTVLVLMFLVYGRFGMYANIALIVNVLAIISIMTYANATLTLPGIAGFVLTVGAAVDANVLINERIREEIRRGRRVFQAVEFGYKEASRAIFDANITNVIAAVLLFAFGSGPIRGFAVVLIIGIMTSVFSAVVITRMWVAGWLKRNRPQSLNI